MPQKEATGRARLILSADRALWGCVVPSLRAASIEERDGAIDWLCVFDGTERPEESKWYEKPRRQPACLTISPIV